MKKLLIIKILRGVILPAYNGHVMGVRNTLACSRRVSARSTRTLPYIVLGGAYHAAHLLSPRHQNLGRQVGDPAIC
ncbi:MAG: hypothetical protein FWE40_04450 [Oscillospiraceae bacterium]|nr:hypothetical protein [Oscillospiraceae bacterium]